jgi:hypothetical protein
MWMHEHCLIVFEVTRPNDDWGNGTGYGVQDEIAKLSGGGWGNGFDHEDLYDSAWDSTTGAGWGGGLRSILDLEMGDGVGVPSTTEIDDNHFTGTGIGF